MVDGRDRQLWAHTSAVLAMIANAHRSRKMSRVFRPSDFNPYPDVGRDGGRRGRRRDGIPVTADNISVLKALLR